jgi:hypothetical protein
MPFVTAAITLAQAGVSVYQALEAKSRMEEAEVAAKKASANALRQTEINPYEKLSVPTAEYMEQREAAQRMVSAGVQAGVEGDQRGAAATAATAVSAGLESEKDILASQERSLYNRDVAVAGQDAVNQIRREEIYTDMATGAQESAADQAAARAAAITGAATGLSAVGAEIDAGRALYKQSRGTKMIGKQLQGDGREQFLGQATPILEGQMRSMEAGQRAQFANKYGLDVATMEAALGQGGDFGSFFGGLGNLTQQELLTQGLTIDQLNAFNQGNSQIGKIRRFR